MMKNSCIQLIYYNSCKVVGKVFSDTKINICKLCLTEKVFMINALNDSQLLNKKSELLNKCRH